VDSSKHASLAFCLSRRPEVDLRVIHLVRDSRAVAYSWTTRVARPDASAESYMTTYSPLRAAGHWNAQNGAFQVLARRGAPVLRIRYEDVVADPAKTLGLIMSFAGLRADPPGLTFLGGDDGGTWAELHASHTASGNPMRFTTGRLEIRRDERWRTAMPARQRRAVTALTLPLLAYYGYVGEAARLGATPPSEDARERQVAAADRAAGRVGEAA
jgi:sulfotransferase family protein